MSETAGEILARIRRDIRHAGATDPKRPVQIVLRKEDYLAIMQAVDPLRYPPTVDQRTQTLYGFPFAINRFRTFVRVL